MRRHLWLIGMMGAGKSTVGRRVAARTDMPFIDTDEEVIRRSGSTITEIWERDGEAGFRGLEREVILAVAAGPPAVVATGGGVVMREENVEVMRSIGTVVWLRAGLAALAARIEDGAGRPLLASDVQAELASLFDERNEMYVTSADAVVDTDDRDEEQVAAVVEASWTGSD